VLFSGPITDTGIGIRLDGDTGATTTFSKKIVASTGANPAVAAPTRVVAGGGE